MKTKICVVLVIVCLLMVGKVFIPYANQETITVTVTGGERTESGFLVYTKNEVFKNTDSWWYLKFASSDLQGELMATLGEKRKIKVYGYRVPFLSLYRNVVKIQELSQ